MFGLLIAREGAPGIEIALQAAKNRRIAGLSVVSAG